MNCIGCGCSEFNACNAGGLGCHWVSHNPPVCSECVGLFDEAEFSGPALDNVTGFAGEEPLIESLPFNDNLHSSGAPLACAHVKRLYVDSTTFKCCGCDAFFCDEAA